MASDWFYYRQLRRGNQKRIIAATVVIGIVGAALIALLINRPWESDVQPKAEPSAGSAWGAGSGSESSPGSGAGSVSGDFDQWREAVCRLGTYTDDIGMSGATGSGACMAQNGQNVLMGRFSSDYVMRNALAGSGAQYYVAGIESDGTAIAFVDYGNGSVLQPLKRFGFTINRAPRIGG